MNEQNVKI